MGYKLMGPAVFPEQGIKENAVDATKKFFKGKGHKELIAAERERLAALPNGEREKQVEAAERELRELLQLGAN
jgi:hypothetical protein